MARFSGAELLERDAELTRLEQSLAAARDGTGSVLVAQGPPGIGKTTLLAAARRRARAAGMDVRHARGGVLEREHPFGIARQLLDAPSVSLLPPSGRGRSAGEVLFDTLERLFGRLAAAAADRPMLVCVDDAHWADVESLRLCAYLAARIETRPIVLALGLRPGEAGRQRELLALIARDGEILAPAPLSDRGVAAFVSAGLGADVDAPFAAACARATGGNPFLLSELVTTARADGIDPVAARAPLVESMTPVGVANAVLVRLGGLDEPARRVAEALAVLGDNATLTEAAALAGVAPAVAADAADALARAGVFGADGRLEFVHPLVRNVVYADLPRARREAAHAAAARLLDGGTTAQLDRVAAHLLAVAPCGDHWAADRLTRAGEEALARGACDAAVAYLARALAEPPEAVRHPALLVSLAQAEAATGSAGAVEHLEQAVELIDDPSRRARVRQSLGRLFFLRGEFELAGRETKLALDELAGAEPGPLARGLLADYLAVATFQPSLRAAEDPRALMLFTDALGGRLPPEPQLRAFVAGAMALSGTAPDQVREVARAAIADALTEDETSVGLASAMLAGAFLAIEDYELALQVARAAAERAARIGSVVARGQADQCLGTVYFNLGRLPEAARHAEAAFELRHGGWAIFALTTSTTLCLAETNRGRLEAAWAALLTGRQLAADNPQRAYALYARGHLAVAEGAYERALEDFQAAGREFAEAYGVEHPTFLPWRPYAALAAFGCGRRELARELVDSGLELARRAGRPRPLGVALCAAGQIVGGAEGLALLGEAVAALERSPARLERAHALVALGSALRRAGHLTGARPPLGQGLQVARSCGATPLAERAHEELIATGARPRKTLRGGRDALTPAELRVARMAAGGLTNRQIAHELVLSTRTVETHLARAYMKLDVSSRQQLAGALPAPD